jgi:nicotinamidase-related amidase
LVGSEAAAVVAKKMLDKAREKHEPIIHVQHTSL